MQTVKGGWVGQTFALATHNDSSSRKSRIRRSKEERKTMAETFIKKYQESNNGNFPSLNLAHKEVGGSFYTVREIVREIIQENRVLGPAKLPREEKNNVEFSEQYPLGSISTEPQSLSFSGERHVISTFAPDHYMGTVEKADFGKTQLDVAQVKGVDDGPQSSASDIYERIEQSDESCIIDTESGHRKNKDEVSYSSGINGHDKQLLNEQTVGDYEKVGENEISGKSDLLNDLSLNHQNTNAQALESTEVISEHVIASFISELDATAPTVKKDETCGEPISTVSVARENLDFEGEKNSLEASKVDIPVKTTELLVEKFPLRPISRLNETSVEKTSEESEHEHDGITSSEKAEQLVNEPVDVMIADPTSKKSSKLLVEKAEPRAGEASIEISSASEERAAIATDIVAKASPTVNGTIDASSPLLNETIDSSNEGSSKIAAADELIEAKGSVSVQHGTSQQKGGNPPLDRIHLETWKGASAKSRRRETNPLLALLKACVTAFVKFWTED